MSQHELRVKLASFEGPLDLLLYLVRQHEISIAEIKITEITEHYLNTLELMRELNLDVAGDFILMASTLIQIKSKAMLPQDEEGEAGDEDDINSEEALRRRLIEHQQFRMAAAELKDKPLLGRELFARPVPTEKQKREQILQEMALTDLTVAFQKVLITTRRPVARVQRDSISVASAAQELIRHLKMHKVYEFATFIEAAMTRDELVARFLGILELARLQKLRVMQHVTYGTIYLVLREETDESVLQEMFERGDSYEYAVPESSA